jgi:hypothetical protein
MILDPTGKSLPQFLHLPEFSLAFLGARKFIFIKNYRDICYPGAGQTQSNDVNSNSSIAILRLLRDRGNAGRNILEGPGKETADPSRLFSTNSAEI